jgi:hypothetical protein
MMTEENIFDYKFEIEDNDDILEIIKKKDNIVELSSCNIKLNANLLKEIYENFLLNNNKLEKIEFYSNFYYLIKI